MNMENRMGPRMEPCGTPRERRAGGEETLPILTEKLLLLRLTTLLQDESSGAVKP